MCAPRVPILLHPRSPVPAPCLDVPDWKEVLGSGVGIPVWALTTLLLKGGKKNHSEFYLLLGKRHWDGREKANPVRN